MKSSAALAILEAAYELERPEADWLHGVARAAAPVYDRGLGVWAYFAEVGGPGSFRAWGHVGDAPVDVGALYRHTLAQIGPEAMRRLHLMGPFGTAPYQGLVPSAPSAGGTASGVMGFDAEGRGVCLATWSTPGRLAPPRRGERAFWSRVAPHLATAARLRRRLERPEVAPEAVLEPGGRVVHAEGDARDRVAREALRAAAVRIDRARANARRADDALELWRCMIEERWTVVDRFERDGRHYVVAYPNRPDAEARLGALTARERLVASAAALGHANKVIAYELGIAESTVATLLTRASRKLGVSSRPALVRFVREASSITP